MKAKLSRVIDANSPSSVIRLAMVEDDVGTRQSWVKLLNADPRVKCVAACESIETALNKIPAAAPQVVLMDINLAGKSGIRCTAALKQLLPNVHILMLTAFADEDNVFEALRAGASGYLLKGITAADLVRSVVDVVTGGAPMTGQIARRVIEVFRKPAIEMQQQDSLTPRENEILHLLAKGYANKEIASELQCTVGTIRIHLQHIYEKLHVHCRAEAMLKCLIAP